MFLICKVKGLITGHSPCEEFKMKRVMFLPGYACTSAIWRPVCEELGSNYDPILVNWPIQATPGFHTLNDFADWLHDTFWPGGCDALVGHSLGGLVAIQLLASGKVAVPKLILVETFLVSPDPFFHNLLLSGESSDQGKGILKMLHRQEAHYSPGLREAIRDLDMSQQVLQVGKTFHALYGDRGCGKPEMVLEKLGWTAQISAHVEARVIPGSCHFPMLENPYATVDGLRSIIDS
jgi:pimeloyl-ACP methyl ester carboxylesterase